MGIMRWLWSLFGGFRKRRSLMSWMVVGIGLAGLAGMTVVGATKPATNEKKRSMTIRPPLLRKLV